VSKIPSENEIMELEHRITALEEKVERLMEQHKLMARFANNLTLSVGTADRTGLLKTPKE
jgi:hypothetical protein